MGASSCARRRGALSSLLLLFVFLLQTWTFLHLPETAEAGLVANCSFERSTDPYCPGWSVPQWTDGPWNVSRGSDSKLTGPQEAENTTGGTYYLYLNSDIFKNDEGGYTAGRTVGLLTPVLSRTSCIAFLYIKHGDSKIGQLRVGLTTGSASQAKGEVLWTKNGTTGDTWLCQLVNSSGENHSIYWVADSGNTPHGDTAIDEVRILDSPCPHENACLDLIRGTLPTSTTPPTSPSTSSASNSTLTSPTGNDETSTQQNSEEEGSGVNEVILYSTLIPIVVLIIAGITAFVCFRRRNAVRRAELEEETRRKNSAYQQEEPYDLPDDVTSSTSYRNPEPVSAEHDGYDVIVD